MIIILCLDDDNGMLFNHRRQSRDSILLEHILNLTENKVLWMNAYSAKLFGEGHAQIQVDENFLDKAQPQDYCFVETADITAYVSQVETFILYRWNRNYPDDFYFSIPLEKMGWHMTSLNEFSGSSHECITEQIFERMH
ncbi:MAG: ribonuclease Z [Lachnospiraceae bacterium]